METVTEKLSNGNEIKYKVINGTSYHFETNAIVTGILEDARQRRLRIKIYLGDTDTGRDWMEEYDTIGTIGRSTGENKIPLLIKTSRSHGGGALLDHCIVKIKSVESGRVLYQHYKYHQKKMEIIPSDLPEYSHAITMNGEIYSRHKSERSAKMLVSKLS